jgi:methyl-accepting chemotaxis protein
MALAQEDIQFIKAHLGDWLAEQSLGKPPAVYEIELRERMVRVEEALKHQLELMREGFARMDQRFEASELRHKELREDMLARFEQMDKRFEQMDKRFEQLREDMLARFEQVDKRFEQLREDMLARFEQVDKRFEQVDKRFEQVDKRFEQVDKRFEQVDKRFESVQQDIREMQRRMDRFLVWSFSTTVAVGGLVVTLVKLWNP